MFVVMVVVRLVNDTEFLGVAKGATSSWGGRARGKAVAALLKMLDLDPVGEEGCEVGAERDGRWNDEDLGVREGEVHAVDVEEEVVVEREGEELKEEEEAEDDEVK